MQKAYFFPAQELRVLGSPWAHSERYQFKCTRSWGASRCQFPVQESLPRLSLGFWDNQGLQEGAGESGIRIGEFPAPAIGLYCISLLPCIFSNIVLYIEHAAVFRKSILSYSICRWQMIGKKCNARRFCLAYAELTGVRPFWNSGVLIDSGKAKVPAKRGFALYLL